jgi:hypothetical protein
MSYVDMVKEESLLRKKREDACKGYCVDKEDDNKALVFYKARKKHCENLKNTSEFKLEKYKGLLKIANEIVKLDPLATIWKKNEGEVKGIKVLRDLIDEYNTSNLIREETEDLLCDSRGMKVLHIFQDSIVPIVALKLNELVGEEVRNKKKKGGIDLTEEEKELTSYYQYLKKTTDLQGFIRPFGGLDVKKCEKYKNDYFSCVNGDIEAVNDNLKKINDKIERDKIHIKRHEDSIKKQQDSETSVKQVKTDVKKGAKQQQNRRTTQQVSKESRGGRSLTNS